MMNVTIQVQCFFSMYGGQAEQPVLAQVEGTDESVAEGQCLLFAHGIVLDLHRSLLVAHYLYYTAFVSLELNEKCRMVLSSPDSSLSQGLGIGFNGEGQAHRCVVQG